MNRQRIADFFRNGSWVELGAILSLVLVLLLSMWALLKPEDNQDFGQTQKRFGTVLTFSGNVQLRRAGSFVWRPVQVNAPINNGDALRTAEKSMAQIKSDGRDNLTINPSSLVVFNSETKGRSYDIKVGSLVDEKKKEPSATSTLPNTPIVKYVDRTRQRLRWSYPVQNQIWTAGTQEPLILAWSASLPEKLYLNIKHDGQNLVDTQVSATQWTLTPTPGTYEIHLQSQSNPQAVINKTLTIASYAAPDWQPVLDDQVQIGGWLLHWNSNMTGATSEVKVMRGQEVLFKKRLNDSSVALPPELVGSIKRSLTPTIAFVRTAKDAISTAWSEPLVLNAKKELNELHGEISRHHVYLTYDHERGVTCDRNVVWNQEPGKPYTTKIMMTKGEEKKAAWQNLRPATPEGFCPPAPGLFYVQALGYMGNGESDELLVARSQPYDVHAELYAPEFQAPYWRESLDGKFQPVLRHPAPHGLQVAWLSADGKTAVKHDKTNAWDWLTTAPEAQSVRMRYADPVGRPLSEWSIAIPRPTVTEKQPAPAQAENEASSKAARSLAAVETEPLSLAVHKRGPLFLSDWHSLSWAEISWDPVSRAAWYEVQTSFTPNFVQTRSSEKIRANKMTLNVEDNRPIYWRARAIGEPGEPGPWTDPQVLRIQSINPADPSVATRSSPESHHPPAPDAPSESGSETKPEQTDQKALPADLP